jgi:hypothetical protein
MLAHIVFAVTVAGMPGPTDVTTEPPANDDGTRIQVTFKASAQPGIERYEIVRTLPYSDGALRATNPDVDPHLWDLAPDKRFYLEVAVGETPDTLTLRNQVPDPRVEYKYAVRALRRPSDLPNTVALAGENALSSPWAVAGPEHPVADWFNETRLFVLLLIVAMAALLAFYLDRAKRTGGKVFIRRIAGIDAMEEAVGRSTEMGRPVLYIPGIDEIQNIQTIAGLLILENVAEMTARYDTEIKVLCTYPIVMVAAEEIVRAGYYNAGRPDAHRPQNVQFISSEQFAFTAAASGVILRDKPATNIYMGRFFAESLILAEAGYVNKSIQIAGTAEITQLPFFIAACDYTIMGEELYAVSAYLSREPKQLATLKATDALKLAILAIILIGAVLNTQGLIDLGSWIAP